MACSRGCCETQQEHYRSISIAPSATPTRNPTATATRAREERWAKDRPAYARLRAEGLQPKTIDGCARLEQLAETPADIELGFVNVPATHRTQVDAMVEVAKDPT